MPDAPAIRVRRTASDLNKMLSTEWGFAEGTMRWGDEPLRLEAYQRKFLQNRSPYRWCVKARQVGFSFLFALEALVQCHLRRNHTAILVSYSHEDAKEKIEIARRLYHEMPWQFQKKLVTDSKTELLFESRGSGAHRSRIVSVPSKAPRGKGGSVYLDELAHYQDASAVYSGSTATISRVQGQLSAASTPLGRRGVFWEIQSQHNRAYPAHTRQWVPWWLCSKFCRDVRRAEREAPHLSTELRVARFASPALRQQFEALDELDFQQEFELSFLAEHLSFFPYELILACADDELALANDWTDVPVTEGRLVAGFDVGRTTDRSELALFEQRGDRFIARAIKSFDRVPFATQEAEVRRMLEVLPIARLSIDAGGIGMNLAENLTRDYPQVVGERFSTESKERWATDFKLLLQRRNVELPRDRELVRQIHSMERRIHGSGRVSLEPSGGARGHADRFWAVALACQKERAAAPLTFVPAIVTARVIGGSSDRPTQLDPARLFPNGAYDATGDLRRVNEDGVVEVVAEARPRASNTPATAVVVPPYVSPERRHADKLAERAAAAVAHARQARGGTFDDRSRAKTWADLHAEKLVEKARAARVTADRSDAARSGRLRLVPQTGPRT